MLTHACAPLLPQVVEAYRRLCLGGKWRHEDGEHKGDDGSELSDLTLYELSH